MTEAEWLRTRDWVGMIDAINHQRLGGGRAIRGCRLRLVGCAALRSVWDKLPGNVLRRAVDVAEAYAVGRVSGDELSAAQYAVAGTAHWLKSDYVNICYHLLSKSPTAAARGLGYKPWSGISDIIRDIFGNPFRPVVFAPEWRSAAAVGLAAGMYEARDFGLMPILADALEDAGCDCPDVLTHCRDPAGVHVRGCWVVDGVLGKA